MWIVALGCPSPVATDAVPPHTSPPPLSPLTGTVVISDNPWMVLEKRFALELSREATARLRCTSPDDPLEDHRLPFVGRSGELRLFGLLPETAYSCVLSDE